jgi:hypothetical protein
LKPDRHGEYDFGADVAPYAGTIKLNH